MSRSDAARLLREGIEGLDPDAKVTKTQLDGLETSARTYGLRCRMYNERRDVRANRDVCKIAVNAMDNSRTPEFTERAIRAIDDEWAPGNIEWYVNAMAHCGNEKAREHADKRWRAALITPPDVSFARAGAKPDRERIDSALRALDECERRMALHPGWGE